MGGWRGMLKKERGGWRWYAEEGERWVLILGNFGGKIRVVDSSGWVAGCEG